MRVNGIISAMLTPLNDDESINEAELRNQVNRQIKAGVAAVFCLRQGRKKENYRHCS